MIDLRFERLVVRDAAGRDGHGFNRWLCVCDCGAEKVVLQGSLKTGRTKSCGCLGRERAAERLSKQRLKHGNARSRYLRTREYRSWQAAKRRCSNERDPKYPLYGGRGITMCALWRDDFAAFLAELGPAPAKHTIDRIDNDGNYEPGNCRWATASQQRRNQRAYTERH